MSAKEQSVIREFDLAGLNKECQEYFTALKNHPPKEIWVDNIAEYISKVKRPLEDQIGRYKGVSFFEAINRIASDLILWYGLEILINDILKTRQIDTVGLCLGNENVNDKGDFWINMDGGKGCHNGEAFNASASFFRPKMSYTMGKWEKKEQPLHYIFCNADGYPGGYEPKGVTEWSPGQEISDSDATTLLIKIDLSKTMYDGSEIRIPVFRGTHSV